VNCR
jgi:hypothetical protein